MALYKGYNTINNITNKVGLTDIELIKQDLMNHFHIRKGEKLMNPDFGTIIWDSLYEPLTESLKSEIVQDITTIANNDPRLSVSSIVVDQFEHGLIVQLTLIYKQTNETETLQLTFDKRSNS